MAFFSRNGFSAVACCLFVVLSVVECNVWYFWFASSDDRDYRVAQPEFSHQKWKTDFGILQQTPLMGQGDGARPLFRHRCLLTKKSRASLSHMLFRISEIEHTRNMISLPALML